MSVAVATGLVGRDESAVARALASDPRVELVRRCADLAETLALAAAGRVEVVVVCPALRGIDRSALSQLRAEGVGIIGWYADEQDERTLRQWGVSRLIGNTEPDQALVDAVTAAAPAGDRSAPSGLAAPSGLSTAATRSATGADDSTLDGSADSGDSTDYDDAHGKVVAVWGTPGAPGRTTVAVVLSALLAAKGSSVTLVDADTHAASCAQVLALLDEAPGVAAATRLAESGRLDVMSLAGVAPLVLPDLRVLTGLPRADRWPEIRPDALTAVLDCARRLSSFVVADVASSIEDDEELSYDTSAPRRNAATRCVLEHADEVLVVGSAGPVGLRRLVRALEDANDLGVRDPTVVVTKVRASAVGRHPQREVTAALERFAGAHTVHLVRDDRAGLDAAVLAGRVLPEVAANSPVCADLGALAAGWLGAPAPGIRRRRGLRARLASA